MDASHRDSSSIMSSTVFFSPFSSSAAIFFSEPMPKISPEATAGKTRTSEKSSTGGSAHSLALVALAICRPTPIGQWTKHR